MNKKTKLIIKIILALAFVLAAIYLIVHAIGIKDGKSLIESVINEEIEYIGSENRQYSRQYIYKDSNNIEYWVDKKNGEFIYLSNPNAIGAIGEITEEKAKELAYSEAAKWDIDFFAYDTFCQTIDGTNNKYTFTILQVDDTGYKTGKFIGIETISNHVSMISMHTSKIKHSDLLGSCIGEAEAIQIAYQATATTAKILNSENTHVITTYLYYDKVWFWRVIIRNITLDNVATNTDAIDDDDFFACNIDATTGEVLASDWVETEISIS